MVGRSALAGRQFFICGNTKLEFYQVNWVSIVFSKGSQLVSHDPFGANHSDGVAYQISCVSGIYVTIHNSSKITVMKYQENNFKVEVTTTQVTELRGHSIRKVETQFYRKKEKNLVYNAEPKSAQDHGSGTC